MKKIFLISTCVLISFAAQSQLLQSFTQENWMSDNWQNANRSLYFYDSAENLSGSEYYSWNMNDQAFVLSVIETNYRNAEGQLDSVILNTLSFATGEFNPSSRIVYHYNSDGLLDTLIYSFYSNGAFAPSTLTTYQYNANTFAIEIVSRQWDTNTALWVPFSKVESTPNLNGLTDFSINFTYLVDTQQWLESSRNIFTYTEAGKIATQLTESFAGGAWINSIRVNNEYDQLNNLILELRDSWNNANSEWRSNTRTNYTNTSFNKVEQFLSEFWSSNEWVNGQRGTYVYSEPSGQKKVNKKGLLVYPNPSETEFYLMVDEPSEIYVFDPQGKLMSSNMQFTGNSALPCEGLAPGIYTLTVRNSKGLSTTKLVKTR